MSIEVTISINASDDSDLSSLIDQIQRAISRINGEDTKVHVNEIDNPSAYSPLTLKRLREQWE